MPWVLYFVLPTFLILYATRKYRESKWGKCTNQVSLNGKVVIITGANSGIGFESAKALAARGAQVILACRNMKSAEDTARRIKNELNKFGNNLVPMEIDLGNLASIKRFAEEVKKSHREIDILINNAGVSYPKNVRKTTHDGFEVHFGINHLGHFLLTLLLVDTIKKSKFSRIIIVSSKLHENATLNIDDLMADNIKQATNNLYANSKLANMYFCKELARRLRGSNVNVYALCPGWVFTGLFRNHNPKWYHYVLFSPIAFLFMKSAEQGAQTVIYCATEPQLVNESGYLYRDCKKYTSKHNFDDQLGLKLWEVSEKMLQEKGIINEKLM